MSLPIVAAQRLTLAVACSCAASATATADCIDLRLCLGWHHCRHLAQERNLERVLVIKVEDRGLLDELRQSRSQVLARSEGRAVARTIATNKANAT